MKKLAILLISSGFMLTSLPADAGAFGQACIASKRSKGNRALCRCIDQVAERELTRSDRRIAVKFFKDPHRAQKIRQSDRASHEAFWKRYKAFGAHVDKACSGFR